MKKRIKKQKPEGSHQPHIATPETQSLEPSEQIQTYAPEQASERPLRPTTVLKWQKRFGNAQVQRMLAQRTSNGRQSILPDPHHASMALNSLPVRGAIIQRDLAGSFPVSQGGFEMAMIAENNAPTGGKTGLRGTIGFLPNPDAAYSNKIGLVQIVKLTDATGTNVNPRSLPKDTAPHVRTTEDKAAGVEKDFFTDVEHGTSGPGGNLLPYYPHAPLTRTAGDIFGFKRSEKAEDIKEAVLFDFPGTKNAAQDLDFTFETVAKADDTLNVYGVVKWSFGIRSGQVVNENMTVEDTASGTFESALEKHRDFYIHEPMTFYFDFDSDALNGTETAKIDTFLDYLNRFPDVMLDLKGFADQRGDPTYNRNLALRRANAVAQALISKGVSADRIKPLQLAGMGGATTEFTKNAITDQDEEANRRGNRRVLLTFEHTASIAPGP